MTLGSANGLMVSSLCARLAHGCGGRLLLAVVYPATDTCAELLLSYVRHPIIQRFPLWPLLAARGGSHQCLRV